MSTHVPVGVPAAMAAFARSRARSSAERARLRDGKAGVGPGPGFGCGLGSGNAFGSGFGERPSFAARRPTAGSTRASTEESKTSFWAAARPPAYGSGMGSVRPTACCVLLPRTALELRWASSAQQAANQASPMAETLAPGEYEVTASFPSGARASAPANVGCGGSPHAAAPGWPAHENGRDAETAGGGAPCAPDRGSAA